VPRVKLSTFERAFFAAHPANSPVKVLYIAYYHVLVDIWYIKIMNMKFTLLFLLSLSIASIAYSQCGKKVILESSQTQYLDARGTIQRTVDEKSTIEITGSEIIITPGGNPVMTGTIKSDTCKWKVPFKEGKSVIKAAFAKDQNTMNTTITIESKDGKTTFLMEIDEQPDRKIQLSATRFQEKN
jgi:hypothetical protein